MQTLPTDARAGFAQALWALDVDLGQLDSGGAGRVGDYNLAEPQERASHRRNVSRRFTPRSA